MVGLTLVAWHVRPAPLDRGVCKRKPIEFPTRAAIGSRVRSSAAREGYVVLLGVRVCRVPNGRTRIAC